MDSGPNRTRRTRDLRNLLHTGGREKVDDDDTSSGLQAHRDDKVAIMVLYAFMHGREEILDGGKGLPSERRGRDAACDAQRLDALVQAIGRQWSACSIRCSCKGHYASRTET